MSLRNLPDRISFFVHPIPLLAVGLMALNDHWMKYQFTGWLTGKLSDFCGVFYFPIFLLALIAAADEIFELKRFHLKTSSILGAIVLTDFLMLVTKLSPTADLQIEKFFGLYLFPIHLVADPTDLISLAMNPLTYFYLKSYRYGSKEI